MARVIAVANHKGGVGKTTTVVNLGAALAEQGQRVLLVDLDPQGSTTVGMGLDAEALSVSMYHVLVHERPIQEVAVPIDLALAVAPANEQLESALVELWEDPVRDLRLRAGLEALNGSYDVVLIDCPPMLNLFTGNALMAAHEVLVPVQSQFFSISVLKKLLALVTKIQRLGNRQLTVAGFLVNQVKARTAYHKQLIEQLRRELGVRYRVYEATIPDSVRVQEASQARLPVVRYDPDGPVAMAYRRLAQEVLAHAT